MKNLHPGARILFRLRAYSILFFVLVFFSFFIFQSIIMAVTARTIGSTVPGFVAIFLILLLFFIILAIIIGEIYARLAYKNFLYDIQNNVVKIERGIIWKKYTSIPLERIQNVDIHRGIIARMANFSSIFMQTAGMSMYAGQNKMVSEGYLPAIDVNEAEKIRDYLTEKINKRSNSGL